MCLCIKFYVYFSVKLIAVNHNTIYASLKIIQSHNENWYTYSGDQVRLSSKTDFSVIESVFLIFRMAFLYSLFNYNLLCEYIHIIDCESVT